MEIFCDITPEDQEWLELIFNGGVVNLNNMTKKPTNKLYLYKKVNDHALAQIKNETVHMSTPDNFNDPYDCMFAKYVYRAALEKELIKLGSPFDMSLFEKSYLKVTEIQKEVKVSCLTEDNSAIKMWAHYANSHSGICIEFDVVKYLLNKGQGFFNGNLIDLNKHIGIFPVIYTDEIQKLLERAQIKSSESIRHEFTSPIINAMAMSKFKIWSDEKEWRLFERTEHNTPDDIYFPISAVYFGLKTSQEDKNRVLSLIAGRNIDCYQMEMSSEDYSLVPKKIDVTNSTTP